MCITVIPRISLRLFHVSERVNGDVCQYRCVHRSAFERAIMVGLAFEENLSSGGVVPAGREASVTALLFGCVTNIVRRPLLIFGIEYVPRGSAWHGPWRSPPASIS